MLRVRVKAPFGAFRLFSAGSYRPTAPFPTFASVYGLLLNIAGIESRMDDGKSPMTLTVAGLPGCQLALGLFATPEIQVLFQQLHNYPVGNTGREHAEETRGNKYNIQPISREFLSGLDFCATVDANDDLEVRIRQGLDQGSEYRPGGVMRYGIPFLGDNNLFLSHLDVDGSDEPAMWLRALGADEAGIAATRLYTWINRADNTKTQSQLFVVEGEPSSDPPDASWVAIQST
jgi:CRISPR-associated protein Cas5t